VLAKYPQAKAAVLKRNCGFCFYGFDAKPNHRDAEAAEVQNSKLLELKAI